MAAIRRVNFSYLAIVKPVCNYKNHLFNPLITTLDKKCLCVLMISGVKKKDCGLFKHDYKVVGQLHCETNGHCDA